MRESNGKSNFTAILKRKGDSLFDGPHITIESSEYPDRVRYEADRVRHIIGELKEEPDILAYDSELHSGYKKPQLEVDEEALACARDIMNMLEHRKFPGGKSQTLAAVQCLIIETLNKFKRGL